jgi:hypothetical protein
MKAAGLALTEQERSTLQGWMRAGKTERRRHFRARVMFSFESPINPKVEQLTADGTELASRRSMVCSSSRPTAR